MAGDDFEMDLDTESSVRAIDRTAMLVEYSEGFGLHGRKLTTGAGDINPILELDEFWLQRSSDEPVALAGVAVLYYVCEDSEAKLRVRDAQTGDRLLGPGDGLWVVAGRGTVCVLEAEPTNAQAHVVALLVNLPASEKGAEPYAQVLRSDAIAAVARGGVAQARVLAGQMGDATGPTLPGCAVMAAIVSLAPGASVSHAVGASDVAVVAVQKGKLVIGPVEDARAVRAGVSVSLLDGGEQVLLRAADERALAIVVTVPPLAEPVFRSGKIVMTHPRELAAADERLAAGEMGALG